MSKTIAVYGSLKRGKYNHSLISQCDFLGDTIVKGTLYRVGSYPALVEGDTEHVAEVYEVDDETYGYVKRMEIGAGYKEVLVSLRVVGAMEEQFVTNMDCIVYYADDWLRKHCETDLEVISSY